MNTTLFTESEFQTVKNVLIHDFTVTYNKCGNIKVRFEREPNSYHGYDGRLTSPFWVLYKYEDGKFLWRRHDGLGYSYPLNMVGRKTLNYTERPHNHTFFDYRPYTISMSYFDSFEEAMNYFVKYLKKYKGITV